jgi:hypothetical protein
MKSISALNYHDLITVPMAEEQKTGERANV